MKCTRKWISQWAHSVGAFGLFPRKLASDNPWTYDSMMVRLTYQLSQTH